MARPTDWHILDLDHDPTPGDPWRVGRLGGLMRSLGDDAEHAARDVRGLVGDHAAMNWIGAAGDAFKEHVGEFPSQLDKVADSHHLCADALLGFAADLDTAQSEVDRALVQGRPLFDRVQSLHAQLASANANANSATKSYSTLTTGPNAPDSAALAAAVRAKTDSQHTVDTLNSQLSGPQAQLEALKKLAHQAAGLHDTAENTAERKIHAATDAGIPPDSVWHKLGDLAATLWHGLVIVAKIVSFIGAIILLVVGGPLWLIIAVVVAGLIILADTLYKYSQGQASLWDVGLAVLACIPITKGITSLAALREAFQAGGMFGAGMHLLGATGSVIKEGVVSLHGSAKTLLTGMADLLKGGGGKLVDFLTTLRGGWAGDGLRLSPADNALANQALADALKAEPGITDAMTSIKDATGGDFKGLDFRLKGDDSLKRKLATALLENPDLSVQDALAKLKDNIRYTFTYPAESYTAGVNNAIQRLTEQGFKPMDGAKNFKNFWGGDGYQGINSAWVDPATGHTFEVQFHTPQSFFVKDEGTHALYEELRLPSTSPERAAELQRLQAAEFAKILQPSGAGDIRVPGPGGPGPGGTK